MAALQIMTNAGSKVIWHWENLSAHSVRDKVLLCQTVPNGDCKPLCLETQIGYVSFGVADCVMFPSAAVFAMAHCRPEMDSIITHRSHACSQQLDHVLDHVHDLMLLMALKMYMIM